MGISTFGAISTIHTFSRKIEWNPHIHCLVTFEGLIKNKHWKAIKSLPWQVLRKSWQKCALDIIAKYAKNNNSQHLKNKILLTYKKYTEGFYVNAKSEVGNSKAIAKYIGRYLARPAIAEYRIIFFNSKILKFWYQSPDSKKKLTMTISMETFLGRILSHIPPKNFKMVRRFGLYSRREKIKYPEKQSYLKLNLSGLNVSSKPLVLIL